MSHDITRHSLKGEKLNEILNKTFYKQKDYVLFCFGEVDIRAHLLNQSNLQEKKVDEIIFALSATIEADTTSFYLFKILKKLNVKVSVLARGIPVGDQLEYTDEVTLARSIQNRRPYETDLSNK